MIDPSVDKRKSRVPHVKKFADKLPQSIIDNMKNTPVPWGPLGYVTYKRTYSRLREDLGRKEEWIDTTVRCINGLLRYGMVMQEDELNDLAHYWYTLKCMPAGRGLWQLGTKTVEKVGGDSLMNCHFIDINEIESFMFVFDELMLGGGVGYSILPSVVHKLPKVKRKLNIVRKDNNDVNFIIPDNREGWVELLRRVLNSYFVTGKDFSYSTGCIRSKGAPINGFGGVASGPEELAKGIGQIATILNNRARKHLRPVDALDILNIIGSIVVSGNVRRSAQIALGHVEDKEFLFAKNWATGTIPNWRAMSNNTCVCNDVANLSEDFWQGYQGNGEPYGLFNLDLARRFGRLADGEDYRPDFDVSGLNPCQMAIAPVVTPEGLKTFADIDVGSVIWSETGWTKVIKKWSTGVKPAYRVRTSTGVFYGTLNHRIVQEGKKVEVQSAWGIDSLAGPPIPSATIDPQDVIDGLVIGDGSVHKKSNNRVCLIIGNKDACYHDSEIREYIGRYRPGISEKWWEIKTTITPEELPRTYLRVVPNRFKHGSTDTICGFLRGLYSANGSMVRNRVTLKATSRQLVEDVQTMLSAVGIRSYVTVNQPAVVSWASGDYEGKASYDLNITVDRDSFANLIGFIHPDKQAKLKVAVDSVDKTHAEKSRSATNKIIETEYLGDFEVFDITVDNDTHTYWTGGLNVSNCGEQTLEDGECCCLVEQCLPMYKDVQEFAKGAGLIYKVAKTMISLPFSWAKAQRVVEKNRRIGIGVTGIVQAKFQPDDYSTVYRHLEDLDERYSKQIGVNPSIKLTTTKPSGTVSLLPGVTPGVHPAYADYYIRRIRFASDDKLVNELRKRNYHVENVIGFDGRPDPNTVVASFPIKTPEGTLLAKDTTAIKQLELQRMVQTYWSDNAVSVTVYYRKEELPEIREFLKTNYKDGIKSVSFLLHSEHGFRQAPYEEIDEETFNRMSKNLVPVNNIDETEESDIIEGLECVGACPIR